MRAYIVAKHKCITAFDFTSLFNMHQRNILVIRIILHIIPRFRKNVICGAKTWKYKKVKWFSVVCGMLTIQGHCHEEAKKTWLDFWQKTCRYIFSGGYLFWCNVPLCQLNYLYYKKCDKKWFSLISSYITMFYDKLC